MRPIRLPPRKALAEFMAAMGGVRSWPSMSALFGESAVTGELPMLAGLQRAVALHGLGERRFFAELLPRMAERARRINVLVPAGTPVLGAGQSRAVRLSRPAVASIVANMFFDTMPWQADEGSPFPVPSFYYLLDGVGWPHGKEAAIAAKVALVLQYFLRLSEGTGARAATPAGDIVFRRVYLPPADVPAFGDSAAPLLPIDVHATGGLDDAGVGALTVDFANKFIGGGVLGTGVVQEEIMMAVRPELLAALPLCGVMGDTEAIVITGSEQFASATGYASALAFGGPRGDPTPAFGDDVVKTFGGTDVEGLHPATRRHSVVAIDALRFDQPGLQQQLAPPVLDREIVKAFVGFSVGTPAGPIPAPEVSAALFPRVATGRWGCGAFNGDAFVKALVQWIAASQAGRPMAFYTFGDAPLTQALATATALLTPGGRPGPVCVRHLYGALHAVARAGDWAAAGGDGSALMERVAVEAWKAAGGSSGRLGAAEAMR